jgi:uncharacterized membrane protein
MKSASRRSKSAITWRNAILPVFIWLLVAVATWYFMEGARHFLELKPETLGKYWDYKWIVIAHITAGGVALVVGILQFWPALRRQSRALHRIAGYVYLIAVLVSSVSALWLAFTTAYEVNWANAFTLQIWASVWITTTLLAYIAVPRRDYKLHEEWMVRSYIVTIAFLISGLLYKLPYIQQLGTYAEVATPLFWMGWSLPLYLYEVMRFGGRIRKSSRNRPLTKGAADQVNS